MSSRAKQVIKIEGDVAKTRPRSVYSSKSSTNEDVKKSVTNGNEVELGKAAHLPLDSLCLIVGKLEFVKDIVTCALVCRHWKDAAFCDVVWRALYLRRWRCEEDKGASSAAGKSIPLGFDSWRAAFKSKDLHELKQKTKSDFERALGPLLFSSDFEHRSPLWCRPAGCPRCEDRCSYFECRCLILGCSQRCLLFGCSHR